MPALRTDNPAPIPILMYHQVDAAPPRDAPFRSLYVSPRAFRRQMALLKLLGYRGLSMSELAPFLLGEKTGRVVGITFDDGYLNNLTNALPALNHHGFSSTCYAVSQHIGKTNQWDHSVGVRSAPLMNQAQMRKWIEGGQEIGAHTMHHARLTQADAATSAAEIFSCKSQLESATGSIVCHFCYPYGDFTQEHVALVRAAGYESATTTQRGRCQSGEDFMLLPRIPVVRSTSLLHLWLKLATRYEDRRRAR